MRRISSILIFREPSHHATYNDDEGIEDNAWTGLLGCFGRRIPNALRASLDRERRVAMGASAAQVAMTALLRLLSELVNALR